MLEKCKGLEAKSIDKTLLLSCLADSAFGQRERVEKQQYAQHTAHNELHLRALITHDVNKPHRADEADGSENAYRRKGFHSVEARLGECGVSHRIGQCQGRHIESDAQGIEQEQRGEVGIVAGLIAIPGCAKHE